MAHEIQKLKEEQERTVKTLLCSALAHSDHLVLLPLGGALSHSSFSCSLSQVCCRMSTLQDGAFPSPTCLTVGFCSLYFPSLHFHKLLGIIISSVLSTPIPARTETGLICSLHHLQSLDTAAISAKII